MFPSKERAKGNLIQGQDNKREAALELLLSLLEVYWNIYGKGQTVNNKMQVQALELSSAYFYGWGKQFI